MLLRPEIIDQLDQTVLAFPAGELDINNLNDFCILDWSGSLELTTGREILIGNGTTLRKIAPGSSFCMAVNLTKGTKLKTYLVDWLKDHSVTWKHQLFPSIIGRVFEATLALRDLLLRDEAANNPLMLFQLAALGEALGLWELRPPSLETFLFAKEFGKPLWVIKGTSYGRKLVMREK